LVAFWRVDVQSALRQAKRFAGGNYKFYAAEIYDQQMRHMLATEEFTAFRAGFPLPTGCGLSAMAIGLTEFNQ